MIRDFKDRDARTLFRGGSVRRLRMIERQAQRRLQILDSAEALSDLAALPSNRFEALKGDRKGQYSIRINDQWRLCFRWSAANEAYDVEIVDCH
jgi:proteic killer suppression protein